MNEIFGLKQNQLSENACDYFINFSFKAIDFSKWATWTAESLKHVGYEA